MSECPHMTRLLSGLGEEMTDAEAEALRRHIEDCPACRERLAQMALLPPVIAACGSSEADPAEHPSDNDLAWFSEVGTAADDSDEIIAHLADCHQCREVVAVTTRTLGRLERFSHRDNEALTRRVWTGLRFAAATPAGIVYGLGALAAYAAECLLLAVLISQLVIFWGIPPVGVSAVPEVWPLLLIVPGITRFVALIVLCMIGAASARLLAGHLMGLAVSRGRPGGSRS